MNTIENPYIIFEHIVNEVLNENMIDYKWYFYVQLYIHKIVNTVRPNPNRLTEVINYNDYVNVATIKWANHLKCEYIPGMVIDNNIADRRMKNNILNPKIILVESSIILDTGRSSFLDIESILKQEKHFLKSIEKSLATIRPDIVIVEGEVSRKVVEQFRDLNITLIQNVDHSDIKQLAWLTQTITIPSIDFLDESFKWGTCEEFLVQAQMDDTNYAKPTAHNQTKYS